CFGAHVRDRAQSDQAHPGRRDLATAPGDASPRRGLFRAGRRRRYDRRLRLLALFAGPALVRTAAAAVLLDSRRRLLSRAARVPGHRSSQHYLPRLPSRYRSGRVRRSARPWWRRPRAGTDRHGPRGIDIREVHQRAHTGCAARHRRGLASRILVRRHRDHLRPIPGIDRRSREACRLLLRSIPGARGLRDIVFHHSHSRGPQQHSAEGEMRPRLSPALVVVAIALAALEAAGTGPGLVRDVIGTPAVVGGEVLHLLESRAFYDNLGVTLVELSLGLALAVILGLVLALGFGTNAKSHDVIEPFLLIG